MPVICIYFKFTALTKYSTGCTKLNKICPLKNDNRALELLRNIFLIFLIGKSERFLKMKNILSKHICIYFKHENI